MLVLFVSVSSNNDNNKVYYILSQHKIPSQAKFVGDKKLFNLLHDFSVFL